MIRSAGDNPVTAYFSSYAGSGARGSAVMRELRTAARPSDVSIPSVQEAVASVSKIDSARVSHSGRAGVDDSLVQERLLATLSHFFRRFSFVAGDDWKLYGALSYLVAQRQPEFGSSDGAGRATKGPYFGW